MDVYLNDKTSSRVQPDIQCEQLEIMINGHSKDCLNQSANDVVVIVVAVVYLGKIAGFLSTSLETLFKFFSFASNDRSRLLKSGIEIT